MFARILPLFLLVAGAFGEAWQTFELDDYVVETKINANKPTYKFWVAEAEAEKYQVTFQSMYEIGADGNKVGNSNIALASMTWIVAKEEEGAFWINGTVKDNGNSAGRLTVLSFYNRIVDDTVKFDVFLQDYAWVASDAEYFALEWRMSNSTDDGDDGDDRRRLEGDEPASEADDQICYYSNGGDDSNQVCFNIADTAQALPREEGGEEEEVKVTLEEKGGNIVILYKNFGDMDLFHDPQFGYLEGYNGDTCFFLDIFCIFAQIIKFILSLFGL